MVVSATFDDEDPERLGDELRRLGMRYGLPGAGWQPLVDRVRGHRWRIADLDRRIAELTAERERLREETRNIGKGLALVRRSEIERIRRDRGEAWSPFPIRGYRQWSLAREGLRGGARHVWPGPALTAVCGRSLGRDEVPHSDGRCGPPGCGIYVTKRADTLVGGPGLPSARAMGLVELTGKVVEHTLGYRGLHATVVALGLVGDGRLMLTDDPATISAAFGDPRQTLVREGSHHGRVGETWLAIMEYLTEQEARRWTSENSSG